MSSIAPSAFNARFAAKTVKKLPQLNFANLESVREFTQRTQPELLLE